MPSRILEVIPHLLPPRPVDIGIHAPPRPRRAGEGARYRIGYDALGGHRLDTEYFGHPRACQYAPEGIGGTAEALPFNVQRPLRRDVVGPLETAVLDLAELIGVHASVLRDLVHLLHARRTERASAAVHERSVVGVLSRLAIVVYELELVLVWIVLADDVPILPEFCSFDIL
jgi:hypothetical protein